jgi:hypothetical protein
MNNPLSAFQKLGVRSSRPRKSWPRAKSPAGTRIDCTTGFAVGFVRYGKV